MNQTSGTQKVYAGAAAASGPAEVKVQSIWSGPTTLGECPTWDARAERLFWIDSLERQIWSAREDGSDARSWQLPEVIGSIGLCEDGRLIAGLQGGFAFVDLSGSEARIERIGDPEPELADTRLNDAKVDPQGRYWCGSMNKDFAAPNASLYRLDSDLTWARVDSGFTVSNGIAFSPDSTRMYFSDSRVDRSYQYDYDAETGALSNRRAFADTSAYKGRIDGATVDAEGNYWGALFQGAAVGCFSPKGALIAKIGLPVSCPTMCSFGGANMDTLYVTSALFLMSEAEKAQEPQAGGLFAITGLGARGIPEPNFKYQPRAG